MAYPLIQFPTFAEFFEMLRDDHGIVLKDLQSDLSKEGAPPISVHYVEGTVMGKVVRCVVDVQDYDARVTPSLHRSVCARFKLDQEALGSKKAPSSSASEADPLN